jgi:antimicrobial peptide system SdpB family protein
MAHRRLLARSAHVMLRLQMAGIYLHASVGKLKVPEWVDGTALYYWLTDDQMGVPGWLQRLLMPLLSRPTVALLTWSVLVFEFLLFMALVLDRKAQRVLLPLGILFHASIAVTYGLTSFFASMCAGLILLLRPLDEPFDLGAALLERGRFVHLAWQSLGRTAGRRDGTSPPASSTYPYDGGP